MVSVEKAIALILETVRPVGQEKIHLTSALERILAEALVAPRDHPPWDNAGMDGYALRHQDTTGATINNPISLRAVDTLAAGMISNRRTVSGEAVRIGTGTPLPESADAVVRVEATVGSGDGKTVQIIQEIKKDQDVRHRGEDLHEGETILSPGAQLSPAEVGLLALMQKEQICVFKKPRVAILATGDELVEPWEQPTPCQIINTNSYTLAAQVTASGGESLLLGIARKGRETHTDAVQLLMEKIRLGLSMDMLLIAGGVGPGFGDHTQEALLKLSAEIRFKGVGIRPGHPVAFGSLEGKPVFALPGNPVAAMVSFFALARPALFKMAGRRTLYPATYTARLLVDIDQRPGKKHYIRAVVSEDKGALCVRPTSSQGSGVLRSISQANGFILLPEISKGAQAGEFVSVQLFGDLRDGTNGH